MTLSIIRRWLSGWTAWRNRQKLYRAIPALAELDRQLAEYRKSHKRGSARIIKAKRDVMTAALRGGRTA